MFMKRIYLRTTSAVVLALISSLMALAPGLALAFDGHNGQGQACWATRGTIDGVFHAAELGCVKDGSNPPAPQPQAPAQPKPAPANPAPAQPVAPVQSQQIEPVQAQPVAPVQAPSVDPAQAQPAQPDQSDAAPLTSSATNGDPYSAQSGVTLSLDSHFSVLSNASEYNANVSGLDPATYDHFKSVALVLLDSNGNPVWTDYPGVDASGHFRWPLPLDLAADTYHLGLVDVGAQTVLAQVAFTVDGGTAPAPQAADAAPPTTSLAGTWDLHLGVGLETLTLNDDGTYSSNSTGAGGTWTLDGTDVTFTGELQKWNNGHATLTPRGYIEFHYLNDQGFRQGFQLTRR
jgi:hypothetical protein